jgi:beta-alanine--pyruvate transaminase
MHKIAPHEHSALWMAFTANRQFKNSPRMLVSAEGMYYQPYDGRQILNGTTNLCAINLYYAAAHAPRRSNRFARPIATFFHLMRAGNLVDCD